jgi:hypothetical protein
MSKKFKLVTRTDESQVVLDGFVEQLNSTSQDVEDVKVRVKDVEVTLSQLNIQMQQLNRSLKNRPEEFDADTKQVHDALKEIKDWKTTQRLIQDLAYRLEKLVKIYLGKARQGYSKRQKELEKS